MPDVQFHVPAAMFAHPTRAAMLAELMGGTALSSGGLALRVGIAPSTASMHLSRLVDGGIVRVDPRGKHRMYRIASADVAGVIEALQALSPSAPVRSLRGAERWHRLREARSCYDHLAGRLALEMLDAWASQGWLLRDDFGTITAITPVGLDRFEQLGVSVRCPSSRPLLRSCLDWSEQRHHLGGALGAAVFEHALAHGWITRRPTDRSVELTAAGIRGFALDCGDGSERGAARSRAMARTGG